MATDMPMPNGVSPILICLQIQDTGLAHSSHQQISVYEAYSKRTSVKI